MSARCALATLAALLLLTMAGRVQADEPISIVAAPQRFLDAFRAGDEATMRTVVQAEHYDVHIVVAALLMSYVRGELAEPPTPRDYLPALRAFARLGAQRKATKTLPKMLKAWEAMDRPALEAEVRLHAAFDRAGRAHDARRLTVALRIASAARADLTRYPASLHGAYLTLVHGKSLLELRRLEEADTVLGDLAARARKIGWQAGEAEAFGFAARAAAFRHLYREAAAYGEGALAIHKALEDARGMAWVTHDLSQIYYRSGRPQEALDVARLSRTLNVAQGKPKVAANLLHLMALVHASLGDYRRATALNEEAMNEFAAAGYRPGVLQALVNTGRTYTETRLYAKALAAYDRVLNSLEPGDPADVRSLTLLNVGVVYRRLGMLDEALEYQTKALASARAAGLDDIVARAASNLAVLRYEREEFAEAARAWVQLLERWKARGRHEDAGIALANLASAYRRMGRMAEATESAEASLRAFEVSGNAILAGVARREAAAIAFTNGELETAERLLREASRTLQSSSNRSEADVPTLLLTAQVHLARGRYAEALRVLREAVAVEQAREQGLGEVTALGLRRRARLTSDHGVSIAAAWRKADPKEAAAAVEAAFFFAESGRALLLSEGLANAEALLAAHVSPALLREDVLSQADLASARERLLAGTRAKSHRAARITAAREELADAWKARRRTVSKIQRVARRVADVVYPQVATVAALRRKLAPTTALVLYQLTPDAAYALTVTRKEIRLHDLGPAGTIREKVQSYLRLAAAPGAPEKALARELDGLLLEPLRADVEKMTRLVFVPDGPLAFLPFDALLHKQDGHEQRLIERFETVRVPSATVYLALMRDVEGRAPGKGLLALGNPTYPSAALQGGAGLFPPLPASGEEVRLVAKLFPSKQRKVLLGEAASAAGLRNALPGPEHRLRALHLACHAFVDASRPRLSGLVLAQAEILDVDAIHHMRIPADLAVLSACDTGRSSLAPGEGTLGFVRGFFFAGVPRIVASVWKVEDASMGQLMKRFYEGMLRDGLSPAAALRKAKVNRLRAGGKTADPYRWSGLVLWGLGD